MASPARDHVGRGALNQRQEAFAVAYATNGGNAKEAAITAGYSPRSAYSAGHDLLSNPVIVARAAALRKQAAEKAELSAERVLAEIGHVAMGRARDVMRWGPRGVELLPSDGLTDAQAAAVAEASQTISAEGGSIRLKMHDKIAALRLLAQHYHLLDEDRPSADPNATTMATLLALTTEQLGERAAELRRMREEAKAGS